MQLIDVIHLIQLAIAKKMLELAKDDKDGRTKSEELNEYALMILNYYRVEVRDSIIFAYDDAERLINEHVAEQWGVEVAHDNNPQESVDYINLYVIPALVGTPDNPSEVMKAYDRVVDEARKADDYMTMVKNLLYVELFNGFESLYEDKRYIWRMDRYVNEVEKRIYQNIITQSQEKAVEMTNSELVWVDNFNNPRSACAELQVSGWICVVPRNMASAESQRYPNIWDSQHRYRQPDGHSGINCRHVWHNKSGIKGNLFYAVDGASTKMHVYRAQLRDLFK